ncbi:MAG: CBS domain-containing protein [Pseudomonadales bacterium]|jgi:CBS domain-containing protein
MSVGTLCNREVVVAEASTSGAEAASLMRRLHVGDLVIVDGSEQRKPVGLITDRDLVVEILAEGVDPGSVTISDIMTRDLETIPEDADLWDAVHHMRRHGIRRLPVVNAQGGLEGILTLDDALELISEALSDLVGLITREGAREKSTRPAR